MNCPQCNSPGAEGKRYCADCSAPLDPQTKYLESFAHRQIQDEINKTFKDQKFVDLETSQAIAERLYLWAKIFAACVALPVAALLIILGLFGINKYSDLAKLIDNSERQIGTQVSQVTTTTEQAQKAADEAKAEATSAEQAIETSATQIKAQVGSANQVLNNVQGLSDKISGLEKQTSAQIHASTERVDQRVSDLDRKIDAATNDIAEQEKKLENTDQLVKTLFSKGTTEYFPTTANAPNVLVLPFGKGALVLMLLKSAPIYQTVEMKWRVASQPRSSYQVQNNLLTFVWGEPVENLRQNPLEVTYVPDPTSKTPLIKGLSVKDKSVFADDTKIMDLP